ncbi:hypothetical protein VB780_26145 [Leptolyngbya sp. CCNP1308]|uniref:PD-(D/E)XK nuclease domain-containing protein n=1 Tax=Leptolyngbya sp. CCNP1308 TaxID=3110255 RepID=UPI002B20791F|nr:hypothetical protein [Leptolyngbya sp. CCNP1308]MEA5452083.1 hypothetical protein [Leptolyngbya sp. CCNP1308]
MDDLEKVQRLIQKGEEVIQTHRPNPPNVIGFPTLDSGAFSSWRSQTLQFLESRLPPGSPYIESFRSATGHKEYIGSAKSGLGVLRAVQEDLESGDIGSAEAEYNPIQLVGSICERFHLIARQLRSRREDRATLDVQDEYDVQDLMHALLQLYFDDIRPEEWCPSYAGKTSRMDFLLKSEQMVIEIKKTRPGLGAKELGSQLIEDIARYETHPNCDVLVCFVYDPDGRIANPRGIENDLRKTSGELLVEVLIRP